MDFVEAIILGIVQGIGEFLPISSSAHLIFFRDILGIGSGMSDSVALTFDVALHLGTLLAIILFFFNDFITIIKEGFTKGLTTSNGKLMWYIVIATIPAALAGFLFEDIVDGFFRKSYVLIALALIIMGIIIYAVDYYFKRDKKLESLSFKDIILIGLGQSLALIPGFSRSGTTIAVARSRGLEREDAAKFSFYLSVPIVLGAVVLMFLKNDVTSLLASDLHIFITGILVSFVTGLICIKFLLQYLKTNDFKIFMWYRILLGLFILATIIF